MLRNGELSHQRNKYYSLNKEIYKQQRDFLIGSFMLNILTTLNGVKTILILYNKPLQ